MSFSEEQQGPPPGRGEADTVWRVGRRELIAQPLERVWEAITDPRELTAWLCDRAEVDLRRGGKFAFFGKTVFGGEGDPDDRVAARPGNFEILDCVEPESIEFRWWIRKTESLVRLELQSHLMQTELRVSQSAREDPGWPSAPDSPNWWWVSLPALRAYLEEGSPHLRLDYAALREASRIRFRVGVSTFPWVIWSKLTTREELARWWGRSPDIDLTEGGTFRLDRDSPAGPERILELTPQRRLVHNWRWQDGTVSRVEWSIDETDEDTLVAVTDHGPWPPSADRDSVGLLWASSLLHLAQLSARGITPREQQIG